MNFFKRSLLQQLLAFSNQLFQSTEKCDKWAISAGARGLRDSSTGFRLWGPSSRAGLDRSAWPEPTFMAVKHQNSSSAVPLAPEKDLLRHNWLVKLWEKKKETELPRSLISPAYVLSPLLFTSAAAVTNKGPPQVAMEQTQQLFFNVYGTQACTNTGFDVFGYWPV